MRFISAIMLAAVALTSPALAADPPEDKLICKRTDEGNTGSNLKSWRKICRKASEWKALQRETDQSLQKAKDKGLFDPNAQPAPMGSSGGG